MMNNETTRSEAITQVHKPEGAPAQMTVEPGAILGNYRIGNRIGAGLLSEVFEAENRFAHKPCAVKLFRQVVSIGPVDRGRYLHETERIIAVGHPGIVQTFGSFSSEGRFFTVMERLRGSDLRAVLMQSAPLSSRVYLPLMRSLCTTLSVVHECGMIHGHLHPGQVMVNRDNGGIAVKICDFGTHHLLPGIKDQPPGWEWRAEHAACIAPEQCKNQPADSRSDIYALCVMLYQMITGKSPFLADTFSATIEQIISDNPLPPSQLSPSISQSLEKTILHGLEKDSRKRFPSVEALMASLDPKSVTGAHQTVSRARRATGSRPIVVTDDRSTHTTPRARVAMPMPGTPPALEDLLNEELTDAPTREFADDSPATLPGAPPAALTGPPPVPTSPSDAIGGLGTLAVPPPSRHEEPAPRSSRPWLFILLAVVALVCGMTIFLVMR